MVLHECECGLKLLTEKAFEKHKLRCRFFTAEEAPLAPHVCECGFKCFTEKWFENHKMRCSLFKTDDALREPLSQRPFAQTEKVLAGRNVRCEFAQAAKLTVQDAKYRFKPKERPLGQMEGAPAGSLGRCQSFPNFTSRHVLQRPLSANVNNVIVAQEVSFRPKAQKHGSVAPNAHAATRHAFHVGSRVRCRDHGEIWRSGVVTSLSPLKAKLQIGPTVEYWADSFEWDEVELEAEDATGPNEILGSQLIVDSTGSDPIIPSATMNVFTKSGIPCVISKKGCQRIAAMDGRNIDVPAPYWGITLSEIGNFIGFCRNQGCWHDNMCVRDLVDTIIKPNYKLGQSVALTDKLLPTRIRWLVSHCWEEAAGEFFDDLMSLLGPLAAPDEGIFVCFLCVYQGSNDEIKAQVTQGSDSIDEGCFAQILESVKTCNGAVCVIPNDALLTRGEGLYSRLWCGWEAYQAKERSVRIVLHPNKSDPKYLFGTGDVNLYTLSNGTCGNPHAQKEADKLNERQIRTAIESRDGWNGVNTRIKIAALHAMSKQGSAESVLRFLNDRNERVFETVLLMLQGFGEAAAPHADCVAELISRSPGRILDTLLTMGAAGASCVARMMFSNHEATQRADVIRMRQVAAQREEALKRRKSGNKVGESQSATLWSCAI